jgi:hypothetical protein
MERWKRNTILAFGKFDAAQRAEAPAWIAVRKHVFEAQIGKAPWPSPEDLATWQSAVRVREAAFVELQAALAEQTFSQSDFLY